MAQLGSLVPICSKSILSSSFCAHKYIQMHVCTGMHIHRYTHMCGDREQPLVLCPRYPPFSEAESLTYLELCHAGLTSWLASLPESTCLHLPLPPLLRLQGFLRGFWRSNTGSHACKVSALLTESLLGPY